MVRDMVKVQIGIAEGALITGSAQIGTAGLGSCVGLVIYDIKQELAGMVHIMLPQSTSNRVANAHKYADTAIRWLLVELEKSGADREQLCAKYAGGSQMFKNLQADILRIGARNIEAVSRLLKDLHIPVVARDVGGNYGRTVHFELPSRRLSIRTARGDVYEI